MKKITAYEIALSALACGLSTVLLTVGVYSAALLLTGYLLSSAALLLPLAKKSYRGFALAYIATCILSLVFNVARFFDVLPFIVFFGLHPLVNELQIKWKINRYLAWAVKAVWFDGTAYLIWRFVFGMSTTLDFVDRYAVPCILIAGTLFFVFYDYASYKCRGVVNSFVARFLKK
jgi:hypothetical protein